MNPKKLSLKPTIAVIGCFQNGKSTLMNCLLDDYVAQIGWGDSTTHISTRYVYGEIQSALLYPKDRPDKPEEMHLHRFIEKTKTDNLNQHYDRAVVTLWKPLLRDFNIIDTPGFNADAEDEARAMASVNEADYLLFVASNEKGLSESEQMLLSQIASLKIPFIMVLNCISFDRWSPASEDNDAIASQITAMSQNVGIAPERIDGQTPVWKSNLMWFWHSTGRSSVFADQWEKIDKRIQNYFKIEDEPVPSPRQLAQKSGFLPIRCFFETRNWYQLNIERTLAILKKKLLNRSCIDAKGAEVIRKVLYSKSGSGAISRKEAEFLFDLYAAGFDKVHDPAWEELFVSAVARHVLETGPTVGEISTADAEWLIQRTETGGQIHSLGKTLLRHIGEQAKRIPGVLKFKMELWRV